MQVIYWKPGIVDISPSQPRNTEPMQTSPIVHRYLTVIHKLAKQDDNTSV